MLPEFRSRCIFCGRVFENLWQAKDHECKPPAWIRWAEVIDAVVSYLCVLALVFAGYWILEHLWTLLKNLIPS